MSSKGNKRITAAGDKNSKSSGVSEHESKSMKSSGGVIGSTSAAGAPAAGTDDDYEKGKKTRSNTTNREELDADRKAVEDLEKWNY